MTCWYCGIDHTAIFEQEHQLPITRGGFGPGDVWACRPCNRLKGTATVEEFRSRLAELLGQPIAFAGEGPADHFDHAQLEQVRAILSTQRVLKLTGTLAGELRDAVMFLRTHGQPTLTLSAVGHQAVQRELARLAQLHNEGQPFPRYNRPSQLGLFADDGG